MCMCMQHNICGTGVLNSVSSCEVMSRTNGLPFKWCFQQVGDWKGRSARPLLTLVPSRVKKEKDVAHFVNVSGSQLQVVSYL